MTPAADLFCAWLRGYLDAIAEPLTDEQMARVRDRLAEVTGNPSVKTPWTPPIYGSLQGVRK